MVLAHTSIECSIRLIIPIWTSWPRSWVRNTPQSSRPVEMKQSPVNLESRSKTSQRHENIDQLIVWESSVSELESSMSSWVMGGSGNVDINWKVKYLLDSFESVVHMYIYNYWGTTKLASITSLDRGSLNSSTPTLYPISPPSSLSYGFTCTGFTDLSTGSTCESTFGDMWCWV